MSNDSAHALDSIKQLMSALNCGASLIDRRGVVVSVNARLCQMMQRPAEQLVGTNVIDLYKSAEDRARVQDALGHFEQNSENEFHLPMPDGTDLPIISSARPLPGGPPLSDHRLVTMIDISKQKEAEQALKQ